MVGNGSLLNTSGMLCFDKHIFHTPFSAVMQRTSLSPVTIQLFCVLPLLDSMTMLLLSLIGGTPPGPDQLVKGVAHTWKFYYYYYHLFGTKPLYISQQSSFLVID